MKLLIVHFYANGTFLLQVIHQFSPQEKNVFTVNCNQAIKIFVLKLFTFLYVTLSFLISVIAVIAATLFPLWPAEMRVGVYYLSVGAGCFVASILLLAIGKCLIMLIWV